MRQYKIIITNKAHSDIADCVNFVKKVSVEAAKSLALNIYSSIATLNVLPERNSIFEMPKSFPFQTRKQVIDNRYIALYSIEEDSVVVYRVLDSRRKFGHLI